MRNDITEANEFVGELHVGQQFFQPGVLALQPFSRFASETSRPPYLSFQL